MTAKDHDIFGPGSNFEGRMFQDYQKVAETVVSLRNLGLKIALTSGTFDLLHVGHSRYLERAKERGDVLIVGVDSDEKTALKKGPHRPVVAEDERMEILCHIRHVDIVFLKKSSDERWQLIKTVRPDALITTDGVYSGEQLEQLKEFCGEVIVLEHQATTSTTARVRSMLVTSVNQIKNRLKESVEEVIGFIDRLTGGDKL